MNGLDIFLILLSVGTIAIVVVALKPPFFITDKGGESLSGHTLSPWDYCRIYLSEFSGRDSSGHVKGISRDYVSGISRSAQSRENVEDDKGSYVLGTWRILWLPCLREISLFCSFPSRDLEGLFKNYINYKSLREICI